MAGFERFKQLSEEFIDLTEQLTEEQLHELRAKKKPRKSTKNVTAKPKRSSA
jgi:hypothetical protein